MKKSKVNDLINMKLEAYRLGRPDMIGKARIFMMTKGVDFYSTFPEIAKKDGFQILLPDYSRTPTFLRVG